MFAYLKVINGMRVKHQKREREYQIKREQEHQSGKVEIIISVISKAHWTWEFYFCAFSQCLFLCVFLIRCSLSIILTVRSFFNDLTRILFVFKIRVEKYILDASLFTYIM